MIKEYSNPDINAKFICANHFPEDIANSTNYFMLIWNDGNHIVTLNIDDRKINLEHGTITCTTYLHKVHIDNSGNDLKTLLFNREFYCVHTYDSVV